MAVAAITTAVNRASRGITQSHIESFGMDTGAGTIPKGAFVCLDASGYAVNGADTAALVFVGIAIETKTFAGSADGDTEILVDCTVGKWWKFGHNTGDLDATTVGTVLYLENNNAVDDATAATHDIRVGTLARYIDADECWLRVDFVAPLAAA